MVRVSSGIACICALAVLASAPVGAEDLGAEAMSGAVRLDSFSLPTAGELFAAIGKTGKPSWASQYREPIPSSYSSRYRAALNLGTLIADGFIAVEAQDGQQVKNTGRDIMALAKTLGVSDRVLARGKSITDFAEANEWSTLKEELEATQNEVKQAMADQQDQDLVTLVSAGAWIRGLQVITGVVLAEYSPESARLIRQPGIVAFLRARLGALPPRIREDAAVAVVTERLGEIEKMVSFAAPETPAAESVRALNEVAAGLVKTLSTRPAAAP